MEPLYCDVEHVIVTEEGGSITLSLDPKMDHYAISDVLRLVAGVESIDLQVVVKLEQGVTIDDVQDEVVALLSIDNDREVSVHGPIAY